MIVYLWTASGSDCAGTAAGIVDLVMAVIGDGVGRENESSEGRLSESAACGRGQAGDAES